MRHMHASNIGPQFWSRNDTQADWASDRSRVSHDIGVVDEHDPRKAAVVSMNRYVDRHDENDSTAEWEDNHGQGALFGSAPATRWTVEGLFAHEDMRHTVPALLGLSAIHSLKTSKKVPNVSPDLSNASKKVVDRLVDAKLVRDPLKGMRRNFEPNHVSDDDGGHFADMQAMGEYHDDVAMPKSDSDHGSRAVRNALGGAIAKKKAKKAIENRPRPHTPPDWRTPGLFPAEPYKVNKPKKPKGAKRA
jgi:hypothetical protein